MSKKILAAACLLLAALLAGCGTQPLPAGVDAQSVSQKATQALDALNSQDYETLTTYFREDMQSEVSPEFWAQQMPDIWDKTGEFISYGETAVAGQIGEDGAQYAAVMVVASYANGRMLWTVTFDADAELIGIVISG